MECLFCKTELIWDSDFDGHEVDEDSYEDGDGAIVSFYTCPCCGRKYQISDPTKEEMENEYKEYWKNSINKN